MLKSKKYKMNLMTKNLISVHTVFADSESMEDISIKLAFQSSTLEKTNALPRRKNWL